MTRHEVVLWAERRGAEANEAARQHGHNAGIFELAGDHRGPKARQHERTSRADAEHFAFVIRALRDPEPEPERVTLAEVLASPEAEAIRLATVRELNRPGPFDACVCGHVACAHGTDGCGVPGVAGGVCACRAFTPADRQQTAGPQQERAR